MATQLVQQVSGEILPNYSDFVPLIQTISGELQREDYINLHGFTGCIQNLSRAEFTSALDILTFYGLPNQFNKEIVTLEISY